LKCIDKITVHDGNCDRFISFWHGDLTEIPTDDPVDLMIVSAFRNDYYPLPSSLIGALHRRGLSVEKLAGNKAIDLRETAGFWLSQPLQETNLGVRRILCFEPHFLGTPAEVVGNLFRGLFPFLSDAHGATVAMPIISAGTMGENPAQMLRALVSAAAMWMERGLPILELRIVDRNSNRVAALAAPFAEFKTLSTLAKDEKVEKVANQFHVFLSFSSNDATAAELVAKELQGRAPGIRLFDYRLSIDTGKVWQDQIDEAMRACLKVVALLSPSYFKSSECREELSVARLLHKRRDHTFLFPLYVRSLANDEELPYWLQAITYIDCREVDSAKLAAAVQRLDFQTAADGHPS
jgi:hypothetical protein